MTDEDKRLLITVAEGYAGDNVLENWEAVAEEFRRDTGFLRPGKSYPLECLPDPEEQRSAWNAWLKARSVRIAAAMRALLAENERLSTALADAKAVALAILDDVSKLRAELAEARKTIAAYEAGGSRPSDLRAPILEAPPMSGALDGGNRAIVNAGTSGSEYGWRR